MALQSARSDADGQGISHYHGLFESSHGIQVVFIGQIAFVAPLGNLMDAHLQRDIPAFERWCVGHHIEIDERLEIRTAPSDNSISIYTKPNVNVAIGESVVRIPKAIVFSTINCSKARELAPWLTRAEPTLELALAFITEEQLGPRSPWHGYFTSLPKKTVDIGVFWHLYGDQDGLDARQWLRGTEAEKLLSQRKDTLTLLERINTYFESAVRPILHSEFGITTSLHEYHRAYSIVSSRAFLVDAYLGLSLVPVADIFNHTEDNHVHLETDYHVCPICGSLQECGHDIDDEDSVDWQPIESSYTADDICEMVANLPIGGDEEVFNTYEDGLTNAQLLCHYGFMLDGNENDIITWTVDELLLQISERKDAAAKRHEEEDLELLSNQWKLLTSRLLNHWNGSQMVYNPLSYRKKGKTSQADESGSGIGIEENYDGLAGLTRNLLNPTSGCLNLNADGQVSLQLWVLLFLIALADVGGKFEAERKDMIELVVSTAERQELIEEAIVVVVEPGEEEEEYGSILGPGSSSKVVNQGHRVVEHRALEANVKNEICIVQTIADLVVEICGQKLQPVYAPELSERQIGEMLDDMPAEGRRLARMGTKHALEFRRILRSCQSAWIELAGGSF